MVCIAVSQCIDFPKLLLEHFWVTNAQSFIDPILMTAMQYLEIFGDRAKVSSLDHHPKRDSFVVSAMPLDTVFPATVDLIILTL